MAFMMERSSNKSIDRVGALFSDWLIEELKVDPERIIWYGRSIGSGS